MDHLISKKKGGPDHGENMVWACRPCNSSKGATDVLEWFGRKGTFPPLLLLRRYLKIAHQYCSERDLLGTRSRRQVPSPSVWRRSRIRFPAPLGVAPVGAASDSKPSVSREHWGVDAAAFSPDNQVLATGLVDNPGDEGEVWLWEVATGKLLEKRGTRPGLSPVLQP